MIDFAFDTRRQWRKVSSVRSDQKAARNKRRVLITSEIHIDESTHSTQFRERISRHDHFGRIRHEHSNAVIGLDTSSVQKSSESIDN